MNRVGDEDEGEDEDEDEEAQRSLLDTGGDPGSSSKNDLLLPHTIADILSSSSSTIYSLATASKSKTSLLLIKNFFLLSLSSTNLFSNGGRWVLTVGNNLWVWWCDWVWCLKVGFANDWVWCMKLKLGLGWISDGGVSGKAR